MENKPKNGLTRLLEISGERVGYLIVSAVLAILNALLTMVPYILIFYVLNELLNGKPNLDTIGIYLSWALVAMLVSFIFMYASGMASHLAAFNILYELRCKIAEKLGKLPMGYVGNRSSGELKKILSDDVERIETFIAHGIPDTVKAISLPLIILTYLFITDWRLALISLIPLLFVLLMVSTSMSTPKGRKMMQTYHESLEAMNAGIVEFVRAMPVMKIFGQSASHFTKYSHTVENYEKHVEAWTRISGPMWGMMMSFLNNAQLPLLVLGLYLYFNSELSLSVFLLFMILGVGYIRPMFALTSLSTQLVIIEHGVSRMDEVILLKEDQKNGSKSIPDEFSIEFDRVHFSYTDGIDILRDVSFRVKQGSITALVGPSGSGKTTIGQLIPRFYDVKQGQINIGGANINDLGLHDLMQHVGFVFQDNMMFYQSMYQNILMGMNKTKEEVIAAAKVARCHEFIMKLPNGYDTHFGEKGVHLSGGEQQRIQLARVILKDPPILVLDEATAFSDPENEHLIMEACNSLIQNKTVVIIAHRLSTIRQADQIVVLNNGKVESVGSHEYLHQQSALYQKMWNAHIRAKEFELTTS